MKTTHWLLLGFTAVALGCGGGDDGKANRPTVVPAEGMLTYQGKPVEGATIILAPDASGPEAVGGSALTDASGRFALAAFPPDSGVVPGSYKVGVSKTTAPPPAPEGSHDDPAPAFVPQPIIPVKYNDTNSSGQTLTVPPAGATDLKIDLQ